MIARPLPNRVVPPGRAIVYAVITHGDQHSLTDMEKASTQDHLILTLQSEIAVSDRCYSPCLNHILIELARGSEAQALLLARLLRNAFQQSRRSMRRIGLPTDSIAIGVVVCHSDDCHKDCLDIARHLALQLDCHPENEISLLNRTLVR